MTDTTLAFILFLGMAVLFGIVVAWIRWVYGWASYRREHTQERLAREKEEWDKWDKQRQQFKQRKMEVSAKLMDYKVVCACGETLTPYDVDYNIYGEAYGAFYECDNKDKDHPLGKRMFLFVSELDDYLTDGE
jgi:hypothetical protein